MKQYRAILIGHGTMGERHRTRFESCGVSFEKVLDLDGENWLENHYETWAKGEDGTSAKDIDFAVVASPASSHYKYAKFFLERKVPVLVEKPLAVTADQAMELADLALANNTLLFVAQSECYNPLFLNFRKHLLVDLKNAAAASRAETETSGHAPLNVTLDFCREHGFSERCRDVNVSLDLLIHDISLFLSLFDVNDVKVLDGGGSGCDEVRKSIKVVSGEFAGVVANFYANRNSDRDTRTISVEFGRNGKMSGFDYSVSLVHYTENGKVAHIPDSLDNEHRFFLKLLAGSCSDWAHRAMFNAAQSVVLVMK